jgi:hypothetical protein
MAPTMAATISLPTLTQGGARVAVQAAEQHAIEIGVPMYNLPKQKLSYLTDICLGA